MLIWRRLWDCEFCVTGIIMIYKVESSQNTPVQCLKLELSESEFVLRIRSLMYTFFNKLLLIFETFTPSLPTQKRSLKSFKFSRT